MDGGVVSKLDRVRTSYLGLVVVCFQPNFLRHLDTSAVDDLVERHIQLLRRCAETQAPVAILEYSTANSPLENSLHPRVAKLVATLKTVQTFRFRDNERLATFGSAAWLNSYGASGAVVTGMYASDSVLTVTNLLVAQRQNVVVPLDCVSDHPNSQHLPRRDRVVYVPSYTDALPLLRKQ